MCKHLLKIQRLILALLIFGGGIFYTSSATARVCFLPDSTDCGEGDVDVPEVQITCATYGGYETEAACLEARTNKTAQTCTLNSGCYYPKCAYDSERKCKNENPDKNCLSQTVDGVKCWYSQLKTCFDQGYKSACSSDENSTPVNIEAFDSPCYKCTEKATCKQMKPGVYYGPNDTCPKYTDRKDAGVTGKDGVCSTCEPQACSAINTAYKNEAQKGTCGSDKEAKKVEGTDSAADGPCYTCEDKPVEPDTCVNIAATKAEQEPTVKTTAATKTETQTDATFRCGTGPTVETPNHNIVIDYNGRLTGVTSNYTTYSYDNATKKYYVIYKNSRVNNGQPLCLKNQLCSDYVSPYTTSPVYREAYYIERAYGSYTSYASQTYCCLGGLIGHSVNELSSCKRAKTNTIQTDTAYRVNATYVCSVGETLSGTKCKKTTYTCPEGYTLDANNVCKQLTCNEGYTLQDVNGQKRCVADAYSCPTDGKYKYKLSGNKCVCDTSKTCSEISNGSWKGEKDKNTCPTGYKPEVVESTIGATAFSDGPCYTCENKPVGCKYEYIRVNPNHTCGNGGNLDAGYSCQRNTCCWNSLSQIKSIDIRGGTGNVMPIYNRISKQSASCVDDKGVTKYETICEGTAKPLCKKAFAPNGCVSASYNNGFDVIGTEWGTCSCDASKGLYDTDKSCSDATSLKCTFEAPCYQTCESAGMYSTEAACMKNLPGGYKCLKPGTDDGDVNCYVRDMGFAIRYASLPKRNWVCSGPTYNTMYQTLRAWLANVSVDSQGRHYPGSYAETLDGKVYSELSDNDLRYKAGSYFVCASRGTTSGKGVGIRKTVIQYTRSASGSDPTTQVCFGDTISSQYNNLTCENSESWGAGYSCKEVTFRKGILYLVSMYTDYQYPGWGYYSGTCNNY